MTSFELFRLLKFKEDLLHFINFFILSSPKIDEV